MFHCHYSQLPLVEMLLNVNESPLRLFEMIMHKKNFTFNDEHKSAELSYVIKFLSSRLSHFDVLPCSLLPLSDPMTDREFCLNLVEWSLS